MQSIGDSSSSCLIDIQIDESLSRETLMNIDSTNQKENCGIFTTCSIFLILCFFSCFFLPDVTTTLTNSYILHNRDTEYKLVNHQPNIKRKLNTKRKSVSFSIESLSVLNQFLLLSVSFIKKSQPTSHTIYNIPNKSYNFSKNDFLMLSTNISIRTDLTNQNHKTDFLSHSLPNSFLFFPKNHNMSQKIPLLKTQLTKYTTFSSKVLISKNSENADLFDDIIECRAYWTFGNSSIPFYQSFIKLLFFSLNLISMISFYCRTKCNTSILHLEQILSIFLLFFTLFIDNPLHYLFVVKSPKISLVYDEISKTIFNIYLRFFMIALFDSLRFKNRRIGHCFFVPKLIFFFFFLLSELLFSFTQVENAVDYKWPYNIINDKTNMTNILQNRLKISKISDFYSNERLIHNDLCFGLTNDDKNNNKKNYEKTVYFFSKIFEIVFVLWIAIVINRSFREIDVTERYKFFMYFSVSFIMFLLIGFSDFVLSRLDKFANTLTPFLFKLSVYNFFALLMIFFHWPYELITDQQYLDPDEVDDDVEDFYNESDKSSGLL